MNFQEQKQDKNELSNLRDQIFYKHLYVSIPMIILLLASFIIINFFALHQDLATAPEFSLPRLISLYYSETIKYMEFFNELALSIVQKNATNTVYSNLSQSAVNYVRPNVGMQCLLGTVEDCNKLTVLSTFAWQYQKNSLLNLVIDSVILCSTDQNLTCAGTPLSQPNLKSSQITFISRIVTQLYPYSQVTFLTSTNMAYIAYVLSNRLVNILRLSQFSKVLLQIANSTQMGFMAAYSIKVIEPTSIVIAQVKKQTNSLQQNQPVFVQISYKNNKIGIIHFDISYTRKKNELYFYTKITCFTPLVLLLYLFFSQRSNITKWVHTNFSRKHLINQLYKHTIQQIFMGIKPNVSNVLQRGATAQMFKALSQLVDKSINPIVQEPETIPHKQGFKFIDKIQTIIQKYKENIMGVMHSKNKYILANRFNIQSTINQLCEAQNKVMKQFLVRVQELNITESFFAFAYNAVLLSPDKFEIFLQQNQTPMPKKLVQFFIKTNQFIHLDNQIRKKLIDTYPHQLTNSIQNTAAKSYQQDPYSYENKQELQIRIRVQIVPKYLSMLKALDKDNYYAQKLKMTKLLQNQLQATQNIRYLLTKHNKSIRMFSK